VPREVVRAPDEKRSDGAHGGAPSGAPRILIVGASGLVGSCLRERFGQRAAGTYCGHEKPGLVHLDVTDADEVARVIEASQPDVIIHTAAQAHVDRCQTHPDESYAINVEGARNVAQAAARAGARYLFFSTDYVFGGDRGPHRLGEPFEPLSTYGRHKLEAETLVAATVADHVIVRGCNLYGYQPGGKNFVMAVFELGRAGKKMRVPSDQWGSPTLASDMAAATAIVAHGDLRGAVHLAGPDYLDRLSLARRAARAFDLDPSFIEGVPTSELGQAAPRPLKGGLDASESSRLIGFAFTGIDAGLAQMKQRMIEAGVFGRASR
jgi:dTDP-4-dehydrorhamnose reductase